jgi:hypothetical protein
MSANRLPSPAGAPAGGVQNPWVINVLRPAALTIMAGCVALPIVQVILAVAPDLHFAILFGACVLTALEVNYTHRLIRAQHVSGSDLWRMRAIEAGFYFVVLKAANVALYGFPAGAPVDWLLDYRWWLDAETLLALILAVAFALAVDSALQDFDRVGEAAEPSRDYISSIDSLTGHFFTIGGVLLLFSGLARVNLTQILRTDRPPVTGLVGNVLLYFLLGLMLISQVRLELLAIRWQAQGVRTPPDLTRRWVRYTLAFVGLAALLAFVLPTGYTLGALGLLGDLLSVLFFILWIIVFALVNLLLLPIRWLLSLISGRTPPLSLPAGPPPPPPPDINSIINHPMPPWVDALRTIFVIVVVAGFVAYIIWSYLRDRPELMAGLQSLAPLRALRRMWAALRHRVSGMLATARDVSPVAWLRERLRRPPAEGPFRIFRLGAASPREQVLFYYASLLRRASQAGFGRRPPQSPREYEPVLEENLPAAAPELQGLTAAFEETRYSNHPVGVQDAQAARARWHRVRAALSRKKNDA